jgi:hypothetical protein
LNQGMWNRRILDLLRGKTKKSLVDRIEGGLLL